MYRPIRYRSADKILAEAAKEDNRLQALLQAIVMSKAFQTK